MVPPARASYSPFRSLVGRTTYRHCAPRTRTCVLRRLPPALRTHALHTARTVRFVCCGSAGSYRVIRYRTTAHANLLLCSTCVRFHARGPFSCHYWFRVLAYTLRAFCRTLLLLRQVSFPVQWRAVLVSHSYAWDGLGFLYCSSLRFTALRTHTPFLRCYLPLPACRYTCLPRRCRTFSFLPAFVYTPPLRSAPYLLLPRTARTIPALTTTCCRRTSVLYAFLLPHAMPACSFLPAPSWCAWILPAGLRSGFCTYFAHAHAFPALPAARYAHTYLRTPRVYCCCAVHLRMHCTLHHLLSYLPAHLHYTPATYLFTTYRLPATCGLPACLVLDSSPFHTRFRSRPCLYHTTHAMPSGILVLLYTPPFVGSSCLHLHHFTCYCCLPAHLRSTAPTIVRYTTYFTTFSPGSAHLYSLPHCCQSHLGFRILPV